MSPSKIVDALVPALLRQDFRAVRHPEPTPNGYGHKITLFESQGPALGSLVIYAGKIGPRYTTNELRAPSPDILARIAHAWTDIGLLLSYSTTPTPSTPISPMPSNSNAVELWVDGACLQESTGMRFGWAYVIRRGDQELCRHASDHIEPHMAMHRNVAAELQAVRHGLDQCLTQKYSAVTVYFDYNGIEAWATNRWHANTRTTLDYVNYIRTYPLPIAWVKVAAHSGIPMNELVDSLATEAARNSSTRHT